MQVRQVPASQALPGEAETSHRGPKGTSGLPALTSHRQPGRFRRCPAELHRCRQANQLQSDGAFPILQDVAPYSRPPSRCRWASATRPAHPINWGGPRNSVEGAESPADDLSASEFAVSDTNPSAASITVAVPCSGELAKTDRTDQILLAATELPAHVVAGLI